MEKLITGIDISDGCPIKLLRDKLLKSMTTNGKKDKLTDKEKIHYVMCTWSKFVIDGNGMKMLRLPTDYVPNIDFSSVPKHKQYVRIIPNILKRYSMSKKYRKYTEEQWGEKID